jgi:hypothetical protein
VAEEEVKAPRKASAAIDRELEAVLLKALSQKAEERYASAGALGEDIDNYPRGEPLTARPATTVYFLRKYQLPVMAAAVAAAVVLALGVLSYVRVQAERDRADGVFPFQRRRRQSSTVGTQGAAPQRRAPGMAELGRQQS